MKGRHGKRPGHVPAAHPGGTQVRQELNPTSARKLFSGTAGHHPVNQLSAMSPAFVTRGGIRF